MQATLLEEIESQPQTWPEIVPYERPELPDDQMPDPDQVWQRIESYIAHRYTPREVVWTVEGPGHWRPRLTPATIIKAEVWSNDAWEETDLPPGPFGYTLPGAGPYRIEATVGGGEVPPAVVDAYRRLHEYTVGIVQSFKNEAGFRTASDLEVVTGWTGRALQLSGAADLLRPYRRA